MFENGANEMARVLIYRGFGNTERLARSEADILSWRGIAATKSEALIPKFKTNSNDQKTKIQNKSQLLANAHVTTVSLRKRAEKTRSYRIVVQKHISEKTNPNQTAELSGYSFQQPYI